MLSLVFDLAFVEYHFRCILSSVLLLFLRFFLLFLSSSRSGGGYYSRVL